MTANTSAAMPTARMISTNVNARADGRGFRFLSQLRFSRSESIAGVLALLFCTTHLHYTQNMTENNYIMLLTLIGFSFQYEWLRTGSRRELFIGSAALGLNLLTPHNRYGPDCSRCISALRAVVRAHRPARPMAAARGLLHSSAPVYLFFGLVDRVYNFYRFGSFTTTYVTNFAREFHQNDPTLPANFPWSTPFHVGALGALFAPEKSIFLFDPLLVLAIVLLAVLWKRLSPELRAYGVTSLLLLIAYICFYARYTFWAGDFAWGDRYVSTTVELVALMAVPLLLHYCADLGRWVWRCGLALVGVSLAIQLASLAFWMTLEIYQVEDFARPERSWSLCGLRILPHLRSAKWTPGDSIPMP